LKLHIEDMALKFMASCCEFYLVLISNIFAQQILKISVNFGGFLVTCAWVPFGLCEYSNPFTSSFEKYR